MTTDPRFDAFRRDVLEEPVVLDAVLARYAGANGALSGRALAARSSGPVIFVGMGSSHNASLAASWWLGRSGVPSWTQYSSDFWPDSLPAHATLVATSKSGVTAETLDAIGRFRSASRGFVIGVTNVDHSPLVDACDIALPMLAGDEGPISAKSYAATTAVLMMLAGAFTGRDDLAPASLRPAVDVAAALVGSYAELYEPLVQAVAGDQLVHVLSSGAGQAGGKEGAVILKEGPGVGAEGLVTAEWLHGAYRAVRPGRFTALQLLGSPAGIRDGELRGKAESLGGTVIEFGPGARGAGAVDFGAIPTTALPLVDSLAIELVSLAVWSHQREQQ